MRIALRTSGGRGEYEVAGSHGEIGLLDVADREIYIQLFPGQSVETKNFIRRIQGKTRIRLGNPRKDRHLYLVMSDILLMPKPKRELGATPIGKLQLTENNYSVVSIQFDIVAKSQQTLVIQPSDLILSNAEDDLARIDVLERMRIILDIWAKARQVDNALSRLILTHRDSVVEGRLSSVFDAAREIRDHFDIEDPLREMLRSLSLLDQYTYWLGIHRNAVEESIIEENKLSLLEASKLRVRQWRMQAVRGNEGQRFSRSVKEAYGNRCLLTGYFLPKSEYCASSGVDAAHILPWADHGINELSNGICLSKLCHWAFDNGIVRITYSQAHENYHVEIPQAIIRAGERGRIDLNPFMPLVGLIPSERLPTNRDFWPSPGYLSRYNQSQEMS